MRDPATGLATPRSYVGLTRAEKEAVLGTADERCAADGYEIDTVLAASAEFRRTVGGSPFRWMTRGEAIHIARALAALKS